MSDMLNEVVRRKDIALTAVYGAGAAALTGIFSGTFYADRADGGWEMTEALFNIGALEVTVALAAVSIAALAAYGSDRLVELAQGDVELANENTLAFGGAFGLPVLHEGVQSVGDITAGEPLMQTLFFAVCIASYVYIAKTP